MRIKISLLFCFCYAFFVAEVYTKVHIYVLHHHGELSIADGFIYFTISFW